MIMLFLSDFVLCAFTWSPSFVLVNIPMSVSGSRGSRKPQQQEACGGNEMPSNECT